MWYSPLSLARRLASPLFLPAVSSYHELLTVAQLDKAGNACAEADIIALRIDSTTRPHVPPSSASSPHFTTYLFL